MCRGQHPPGAITDGEAVEVAVGLVDRKRLVGQKGIGEVPLRLLRLQEAVRLVIELEEAVRLGVRRRRCEDRCEENYA
jgi:hypothetical protein